MKEELGRFDIHLDKKMNKCKICGSFYNKKFDKCPKVHTLE